MSGLECGHRFCKLCWGEYLKTKVMDEGMGQVFIFIGYQFISKKTFPSNQINFKPNRQYRALLINAIY